jgi:hypothetical protein
VDQQVERDKNEKYHGDDSIHGKECGVEFTQIVF